MKIFTMVVLVLLLTNVGAMAMTAKVKDENKVVYEVIKGDSNDMKVKSGLAVDVEYTSEHVGVGVSANVTITITTGLTEGTLKVNIRALKENTTNLDEEDLEFRLTKEKNSFLINLQFSSEIEGRHYINLTMTVEGRGSRVIVVPVNIGTISNRISSKQIERTANGEAISVSVLP